MKIDKEEHQQFLLELVSSASYPGQFIELAFEVKQAIKNAEIAGKDQAETQVQP